MEEIEELNKDELVHLLSRIERSERNRVPDVGTEEPRTPRDVAALELSGERLKKSESRRKFSSFVLLSSCESSDIRQNERDEARSTTREKGAQHAFGG